MPSNNKEKYDGTSTSIKQGPNSFSRSETVSADNPVCKHE